ncbi:hypothetical protein IAU60_005946 [Kwoniella sp. DSM 27419]
MESLKQTFEGLPLLPAFAQSSSSAFIAIYTLEAIGLFLFLTYVYAYPMREYTLPYRNLRGPQGGSFLWGQIRNFIRAPPNALHGEWIKVYGPTFRYKVLLGMNRFFTSDPVALNYILGHSDLFPKPEQTRKGMADMLGNGVLVAEGPDHRRQRKVLNPSFSPAAIRGMVPIFYDKAYELRDKFLSLVEGDLPSDQPASITPPIEMDVVPGAKKIDVLSWLGKATLDIIGLAGFNYDFRALEDPNEPLNEAYRNMFAAGLEFNLGAILQALIPVLRAIPTKRIRTVKESTDVTKRIGRRLIEDKKKAIAAAHAGGLEKNEDIGNDLLSILIRANMAADLRADQKMSDDEVLAQITTFMLAGNETSSTALTWILYCLAQNPESQKRLRDECMAVADERPSLETLNSLTYMDAVIREVLRLNPPAPATMREAAQDSVIPLGTPVKGRDGQMIDSVRLRKGTAMMIPIMNVNTSPHIWGDDAAEYNPDRFLKADNEASTTANAVPGVWGNLLTFLGGTRNCIGYRFALAEIKAILFVLIRGLEFDELPSKPVVERKASIVMRPRIVGEEKAGLQMPLLVRPLSSE